MLRIYRLARFHRRGGATWPRALRKACAIVWQDITDPIRLTY